MTTRYYPLFDIPSRQQGLPSEDILSCSAYYEHMQVGKDYQGVYLSVTGYPWEVPAALYNCQMRLVIVDSRTAVCPPLPGLYRSEDGLAHGIVETYQTPGGPETSIIARSARFTEALALHNAIRGGLIEPIHPWRGHTPKAQREYE